MQAANAVGATARLLVRPGAGHSQRDWPDVPGDHRLFADWFDQYLRPIAT